MSSLLVLGGIVLIGYCLTMEPPGDLGANGFKEANSVNVKKSGTMFDMSEMGMSYGTQKSNLLQMANLNSASLPFSAAYATPTRSVRKVFENMSENVGVVEQYGYNFYLNTMGMIPIAAAQQSNLNVEIGANQIKGDPTNSLGRYPRVLIQGSDRVWTKPENTASGMPEESEVQNVPKTGKLNRFYNPWGPGGVVQRLASNGQESRVRENVANQSRILKPPRKLYNAR